MGRWTRAGLGLQVGLAALLAVASAALLVLVVDEGPLHVRADLSTRGRNTLDPATLALLEALPAEVQVEVFFRPQPGPYAALVAEAQVRMNDLLFVAEGRAPERIRVRRHDLSDLAAVEQVMAEIGERDVVNKVVLRLEGRKAVLGLLEDLAVVDPGSPDPRAPRPPSLTRFRGEEALAEALARLSSGAHPRVLFSRGHGELDLESLEPGGLARLGRALQEDGFAVGVWDGSGAVPADCEVLALVGPAQPFSPPELEAVRAHVARGGRLFASTAAFFYDGPGSLAGLLSGWGMGVARGVICLPVWEPAGGREIDGVPECARLYVRPDQLDATHPVTAPLVRHQRRLFFPFTRSFQRGASPPGGILLDLARSPADSWRDLPDPAQQNQIDFHYDNLREEYGSFSLCMAAELPAADRSADPGADPGTERTRLFALATSEVLTNAAWEYDRDFALNAFNWLARRDFKVRVSTEDPLAGRIDLDRGTAMVALARVCWYGLPGLCAALGLITAWRRRR